MSILYARGPPAGPRRVSGHTGQAVVGPRPLADARVLRGQRAEQLVGAHAERGGEGGDVVEGQAALAGLEAAERRDVDARPSGDLLERQAALRAQLPEPAADADVDGLLGSVCLHGK